MKKIIKSRIFYFILGMLLSGVTVYAANYAANEISFTTSKNSKVKTVKDALDDLYSKKGNDGASNFVNASWNYIYSGNEKTFIAPVTGKYKLEVWGAQGGTYDNKYYGGYGGYSVGVINLNSNEKLYINVGGSGNKGQNGISDGGYNGGGSSYGTSSSWYKSSGGGATHIATRSGLLSSLESYKSDILIVSGGGGGSVYNSSNGTQGGHAGGYIGNSSSFNGNTCTGGNQNNGGQCTGSNGLFGQGGGYNISKTFAVGGGSGYYGGSSGPDAGGGAGGSSYIGNSSLSSKHMSCYNCSTSDDDATKTISNNCHSYDPKEDCAKEGNGYVKITYIGN